MGIEEIFTEVGVLEIDQPASSHVIEIFTEDIDALANEVNSDVPQVIEIFTQPIESIEIVQPGPRGLRGDQGIPGPPGIPSVGAATRYVFSTPVYVWEGEHPYVNEPTVILLEPDGTEFWATVRHPQPGLVVVNFSVPQIGTLVIRA